MAESLIFTLKTPLDAVLKFVSLEGSEELSRPFDYSVVAVAKSTDAVGFEALLGKPAQVQVAMAGNAPRHYHGLITAASYEGQLGSQRSYRLTLRPWLWLMTRASQVRIFQKKSVPDILKAVFTPYGGVVDFKLTGTYAKREYCVQYRETDFNFVSRLMEDEGIFYFFTHADGKHTMVLADAAGAHVNQLGVTSLPFRDVGDADQGVQRWRWSEQIQTTSVVLRDRHFQRPTATLQKSAGIARGHAHNKLEAYDSPAGVAAYTDEAAEVGKLDAASEALAKIRVEEQQARHALIDGNTNSTNLATGARFKLAEHPVTAQNGEYIVLSTRIMLRMPGYEAGASSDAEHQCQFMAFASKVAFRPARITPKPTVAGPQTATVVGPAGEEIYVDKYGRVKVQFHWDREGGSNADSSCFVRVSQASAGKGWGMVFLPRIGHEVVVNFLEGDPDQPLITGSVHNADNMPPYALPDKKTVSTIKSRSSMKGGATDFNELRFDDAKGSEYLLLQAQKDKLELVKNDSNTQIDHDMHLVVKKDRKEKVGGDFHIAVTGAVKQKFDGLLAQKVASAASFEVGAAHSLKAGGDISAQTDASYSIKAGTALHVKVGTSAGVDAGTTVYLKAGTTLVLEAGTNITLKAGPSSVVLGPDGVSITGPLVKLNSGGAATPGTAPAPVAPKAPEAPTDPVAYKDPLSHS